MWSMTDGPDEQLPVRLVWPRDATKDATVINNAAVLWDGEPTQQGVYLLLGHVGPPAWFSAAEAKAALAETDSQLQVDLRGSFFMTRTRAKELWTALGQHLEKAEQSDNH